MITINARLWFDRRAGNTYHSVHVVDDCGRSHVLPFAYGYGQQYIDSAAELIGMTGTDLRRRMRDEPTRHTVVVDECNVSRRRDLHGGGK